MIFDEKCSVKYVQDCYQKNFGLGLYNGKCGIAILSALFYSRYREKKFQSQITKILSDIERSVGDVETLDFREGITGIGFTIEWLSQNNFVDVDTNDVLEEIDNLLYKDLIYSASNDFSLSSGVLGTLYYFIYRYKSINIAAREYKYYFIEECLLLLTSDLDAIVESIQIDEILNKNDGGAILAVANFIIFLSYFFNFSINQITVEKNLYKIANAFDQFLLINRMRKTPTSLTVAYAYYFAGVNLGQRYWKKRALEHLKLKGVKVDKSQLYFNFSKILSQSCSTLFNNPKINRFIYENFSERKLTNLNVYFFSLLN